MTPKSWSIPNMPKPIERTVRYFLLAVLCCVFIQSISAQDQKLADSLAVIYGENNLSDDERLELLRNLSFNEMRDLSLGLKYAEELISLSEKLGNDLYLSRGYLQKGNKIRYQGNFEQALDAYFKSAEAAKKADFKVGEGSAYIAIADIYSFSNNPANALLYYYQAISTLRMTSDSVNLASAILNLGDEHMNLKNYDSALVHFSESKIIFDKLDYPTGKAISLGNLGMVYANIGKGDLAESNINEAILVLEASGNYHPICTYLISMSDIYTGKGENEKALAYAKRSLNLAQIHKLKEQMSDANLKLSELYEKIGNTAESFRYYKDHIAYRDSINNLKSIQKMADLRTDFEVSQKQAEVDLLNQEKRNQRIILISLAIIIVLGVIILSTLFWYFKNIQKEKKRSEDLLLNILPTETARQLKVNGKIDAIRFDKVTVLFTDFVEFSMFAEKIAPEKLVYSLDYYFKGFDEIISRYGLEKIKTIGDSYMCAGGIPVPNKDHAITMAKAAKEMLALVENAKKKDNGFPHFDVRIGIHTGPVVAGIVGSKKWQYDIWGDTVNIASRMESSSLPGKINLSETTYELIKDHFECEYRGEMQVKNRGNFKMYFLK
jgi:adenylate cyclase